MNVDMPRPLGANRGFSLIEVMIALVVLAGGLLGLALLQTMNLRYTQNANNRTQAVNLASQLVDMMRSNRSEMAAYAMNGDMSAAPTPPCEMGAVLNSENNVTRWTCEVRKALGEDAQVRVEPDAATGAVVIEIAWTDDNLDQSTSSPMDESGKIEMRTQL